MYDNTKKLTKEVWWLLLLTGVVSAVFGLVALFWPALTFATFVYFYAIFIVVAGAVGLFEAISNIKKDQLWWLSLLVSLLNLGIGVYLLRNPLVAATLLVFFVALFVFLQAIFDFVVASYLEKGQNRWLWIISGVLGLFAGIVILVYPLATTVAFVWVLGLYALVHGIVSVAYAFKVRGELKKLFKK
ncbi:hypothetical protein EOL96_06435 [Candidatus Saccharibacteria bacterium]|nr:hypothetical protein [Candidatus Saccharibacteria bacterium]